MSTAQLQILSFLIAALGFALAFNTFRTNQKLKRAEWLLKLFEKFYENESFKEVRRWIESGEIEKKIKPDDTSVTTEDEKLADYLNFFEFISTLESEGQLKRADVYNLFHYYLKKLKTCTVCSHWINRSDYGFEKLRTLLLKI